MAIHDIDVEQFDAGAFNAPDFVGQPRKIRR